jgi:hypothetical protein
MLSILASAIFLQTPEAGKLFVPACTAYIEGGGAKYQGTEIVVDGSTQVKYHPTDPFTISKQPNVHLIWIGYLSKGKLRVEGMGFKGLWQFRLIAKGMPGAEIGATPGTLDVPISGYYRILVGPKDVPAETSRINGLELSGPAVIGAKFNLKERRNAPSVHLKYPLPPEEKVEWFYNEIRPQTDHPATYYQACGFHRGYFGIQVNSPTERRIIFSVWDSGDVPDDRAKVKKEDLVQCLEKGKDVVAEGFGNEGTGGHSHLVYNWKTKDVHRFLVHAQPDGDKTIYTGYYWFNETKKWGLIAKFRAPKDGSYMKGLYSFNENFWGDNGYQLFAARFGPGWVRRPDGSWRDLTNATFSCDKTGREDRFDYSAGTKDGLFFLTNGGAVANGVKYGDPLVRPASKLGPPKDLPTQH